MNRPIAEAVLTSAGSIGIAVAILAIGVGAMPVPPPSVSPSVMGLDADVVALAPLAPAALSPLVGPEGECRRASVVDLAGSGIRGSATLCSTPEGIRTVMDVENLVVGNIYTVWLAYFDRASSCQGARCTLDDTLGDDPTGVLGRLDGGIANDRRGSFSGQVRDLRMSIGSQASLVLFGHGAASTGDQRLRARQLLTPQSPRLGAPLSGPVADGEIGSIVAYAAFEHRPDP